MAADRRGRADPGAGSGAEVLAGIDRFSRLSATAQQDPDTLIDEALKILIETLDVGLAFMTRAENATLRVTRVVDRAGLGLQVGDTLPRGEVDRTPHIVTSYRSLTLEPARMGAKFASRTVKNDFGVAAVSAIPMFDIDGSLYGTLATLNRQNRAIKQGELVLLNLVGRRIMELSLESRPLAEPVAAEPVPAEPITQELVPAEPVLVESIVPVILTPEGPNPILLIDPDGQILALNSAAERESGYRAADVVGLNFTRAPFWGAGAGPRIFDEVALVMAGNQRSPIEIDMSLKDQDVRLMEATVLLLQHEGEVKGVQIVLREVRPAPKQTDVESAPTQEIEPSAAPADRLFESSPLPTISFDSACRVTAWNSAARNMFGWPDVEVIGKLLPAIPPGSREEFGETLALVVANDMATDLETRWNTRDGLVFDLGVSAAPLRGPQDEVDGVIVVVDDLADRRQVETDLRNSLVRHRQMFEKDGAAKLLVEPDSGAIIDANAAACTLYGYSGTEFRKLRYQDIDADGSARDLEDFVQDGASPHQHRLASSESLDVVVRSVPIIIEGRRHLYVTVEKPVAQSDLEEVDADAKQRIAEVQEENRLALIEAQSQRDAAVAAKDVLERRVEELEDLARTAGDAQVDQSNIDELVAELEQANREADEARVTAAALKARVAEVQETASAAEIALQAAQVRQEESRIVQEARIDELELEAQEAREVATDREARVAALQVNAGAADVELQAARSLQEESRAAQEARIAELEMEAEDAREAAADLEARVAEMQEATGATDAEAQAARTLLQESRTAQEARIAELEIEAEEAREAAADFEARMADMQEATSTTDAELQAARTLLEESRAAQTARIADLEREAEEAAEAAADLEARMTTMQQAASTTDAELQATRTLLEESRAAQTARIADLEMEAEDSREAAADLEARMAVMQETTGATDVELLAANRLLEETRATQKARIAELEKEAERARLESALIGNVQAERMRELEQANHQALWDLEEAQAAAKPQIELEKKTAEFEDLWRRAVEDLQEARASADSAAQSQGQLEEAQEGRARAEAESEDVRALLQLAPVPMILVDEVGLVRMWNQVATDSFGWREAEVAGLAIPAITFEERPDFDGLFQRALAGEKVSNSSMRWRTKDNVELLFEVSMAPAISGEGEIIGVICVLTDASRHVQANEARRQLEAELSTKIVAEEAALQQASRAAQERRQFVEYVPLPMLQLSSSGVVSAWNPAAEAVFGWSAAEALGREIPFVAPESHQTVLTLLNRAVSGETVEGERIAGADKDGESLALSLSLWPAISEAENGSVICVIANMTESMSTEGPTQSSDEYRALVESSPDGMLVLERDGTIVQANHMAAVLYGYDGSPQMVGIGAFDLIPDSDRAAALAEMERTSEAGAPATFEMTMVTQVGTAYLEFRTGGAFDVNGGEPRFVAVIRDISERREAGKRASDDLAEADRKAETDKEAGFRQLFDSQPEPMVVFDLDTLQVLEVNDLTVSQYGISREDLADVRLVDLVAPEDSMVVFDAVDRLKQEGEVIVEWRIKTKEGRLIDVENHARTVAFGDGRAGLLIGHDVTEQRQTEVLFRESLVRHRQMFERDKSVKLVIDTEHGAIVDANPAACAYYGYQIGDFKSVSLAELDADLMAGDGTTDELLSLLARDTSVHRQHCLASGEIRDIEINSSLIAIEDRNLLYASVHDMTDSKHAQQIIDEQARRAEEINQTIKLELEQSQLDREVALEESLRLQQVLESLSAAPPPSRLPDGPSPGAVSRTFVDAVSDAMLVTDPTLNVLTANISAARLFGFPTAKELLAAGVLGFFSEEDQSRLRGILRTDVLTDKSIGIRVRVRRKRGAPLEIEARGVPLETVDGKATTFVVTLADQSATQREKNGTNLLAPEPAKLRLDLRGRVTFASDNALNMLGYSSADLMGNPLHEILHRDPSGELLHPPGECNLYAAVRDRQELLVTDEEFRRKNDTVCHVSYTSTPARDGGRLVGAEVVITDLEALSDAQSDALSEDVEDEEDSTERLIERAPIGVCITNKHGNFQSVNATLCAVLGFARSELVGKPFSMIVPEANREEASKAYAKRFAMSDEIVDELEVVSKAGQLRTILCTTMPPTGEGEKSGLAWFIQDITERKRLERRLGDLPHQDTLTGLPNHIHFADRLKQTLAYAHRRGHLSALIYIDLDNFSDVNEKVGADAADGLLKEVAERIQESTRSEDTVARLGGDKFTIILPDVGSAHNAGVVAGKIQEALARGFTVNVESTPVTASIGISVYPFDARDADGLLASADSAVHRAKDRGKDCIAYFGVDEE